jgi:metal-sulfur cluster biosynthetic enzyme
MSEALAGVLEALGQVYDPELDEPITQLGFISYCRLSAEGDVEVGVRLPTPQCAPNFAFLMAADAQTAVRKLKGVRSVTVRLEDHYTGQEINEALARGDGFAGAFPGETADDQLHTLRQLFERKALLARQARLCEALLAAGETPEALAARKLSDLPSTADAQRCIQLRQRLGLPCAPDDPAFVLADGSPLAGAHLHRWLRSAQLVRMSLEVNGGICRSLLAARHSVQARDGDKPAAACHPTRQPQHKPASHERARTEGVAL